MEKPILQVENLGKCFGKTRALEGISLSIAPKEIIGLVGDNGAGKSTFVKILSGYFPQTQGDIYWEGELVHFSSPKDSRTLGIETTFQDLALVKEMTIARNFFLGREPLKSFGFVRFLDKTMLQQEADKALKEIGIHVRSVLEPVSSLSGGERQSIAISSCLYFGTKLLILDEPTSALSISETKKVFSFISKAREKGLTIIMITHNLHHIFSVCERFLVLSHGQLKADLNKSKTSEQALADLIL